MVNGRLVPLRNLPIVTPSLSARLTVEVSTPGIDLMGLDASALVFHGYRPFIHKAGGSSERSGSSRTSMEILREEGRSGSVSAGTAQVTDWDQALSLFQESQAETQYL